MQHIIAPCCSFYVVLLTYTLQPHNILIKVLRQ